MDEIIPEIDYISFYQSVNNNKERLAQQLTSRKEVGLDEDEIARAILIIVNALFYSDINSDEDSYYTKFIKGLPGLRIGGWILPYAYESLLKISIAARVAALENGLGSEATARVKGVASTAFANEAAQRLDILDTEQSIRIIRRVSDRMEYISIIEKIRFEGQNSNGEVDDGNMQKYIKDFSGFLILLLQYQKDFVSNSIFWSDKKDESYVKDMVKKFLEKSAIKCFDQNILNKFCSTPAMAPIFWQYCMNNHQKIEIKGYAVVDYILKNGKASIFQFLQQINFEDMSNKEKIDLLYRMCQWALEIKEGSYTSLNSDVIQKILPSLPMSEILAIIGKPSFCAFPELVQGLKDNQLV
ncbi:MAG: hypothetical protein LBT70_00565, partial [Holosporaceae bacterium]|nr:hypothetical protein [Holosporaceae bacterium]